MEINRFQKVLKSAASFVTYRFCHATDVINMKRDSVYVHIKRDNSLLLYAAGHILDEPLLFPSCFST